MGGAGRYDIDSDWYEADHVIQEVEIRLSESLRPQAAHPPHDY